MTPRLLTPADLPGLMRLSRGAGWNQTEEDWLRILRLEPEGCFGLEVAGELAATATILCYSPELAWIGMVLTAVEHRGHGLARRLMEEAVAYGGRRGVSRIRLDATDMGRPLYAKLGFRDEYAVERWRRAPGAVESPPVEAFHFPAALDREAFGVDRARLIEVLARHEAASCGEAYAMGHEGFLATYFGPAVARRQEDVRTLLSWFLAHHPGEPVFWDLILDNARAVALAREAGFAPVRRLTRMTLGTTAAFPERTDLVYALAGFEFG